MKKRLISLFVVMTMILSICPVVAHAVASGTCGDNLTWELDDSGTIKVSGTGTMYNFSKITDMPWYEYKDTIFSVTIEDGVTSIGKYAFYGCSNLKYISIPQSIRILGKSTWSSFGSNPFGGCINLARIDIDSSNEYYYAANGIVYDKYRTTLICYPASKPYSSYKVPSSIAQIAEEAFSGCENLRSVTIPSTVTYMGPSVFKDCSSQLVLHGESNSIAEQYSNSNALSFSAIDKKTAEPIISTIETMASGTCGSNITWNLDVDGTIIINGEGDMPDEAMVDWIPWYNYSSKIKKVIINDGITHIGQNAFNYCYNLKNVIIPESVYSIGSWAFANCSSLEAIDLPSELETVGEYAFSCSGIKQLDVPESVFTIEEWCFSFSKLTKVNIKSGMISIESYAFTGCEQLKEFVVGTNDVEYGESVFFDSSDVCIYGVVNSNTERYALINDISFKNVDFKVTFEGGNGTANNPYQIATAKQLDAVRDDLSANYILINDINLSDWGEWNPIGSTENNPFTGTLDGRNHSIKNMLITEASKSNKLVGVFGCIENGIIKNVNIIDFNIDITTLSSDNIYVGSIAGFSERRSAILNCKSDGKIKVYSENGHICSGGIVGNCITVIQGSDVYTTSISNCTNNSIIEIESISESATAGGVCGIANAVFEHCTNTGNVKVVSNSASCAGGISGSSNSEISNCNNSGKIEVYANTRSAYSGGITGDSGTNKIISNCNNTGEISASSVSYSAYAGGVVGYDYWGSIITDCINTAPINSFSKSDYSGAGGIAGISGGSIINCENRNTINASSETTRTYSGGIVGELCGESSINNCTNNGTIKNDGNCNEIFAGGISGGSINSVYGNIDISDCVNNGAVVITTKLTGNVGGIVGYLCPETTIVRCVNNANVSLTMPNSSNDISSLIYAGGILGFDSFTPSTEPNKIISECKNYGSISSKTVDTSANSGGIIGESTAAISNCYNEGKITASSSKGWAYSGGIAGKENNINDSENHGQINAIGYYASYSGGIAGSAGKTIINCKNFETVSGNYAGGIIGIASAGFEQCCSCENKANIADSFYAGGIIGYVSSKKAEVINCNNQGNISNSLKSTSNYHNYAYAGGIVGYIDYVNVVNNCINYSSVYASSSVSKADSVAGGIVGYINNGELKNCVNKGGVKSHSSSNLDLRSFAGGIVGQISTEAVLSNCNSSEVATAFGNYMYTDKCSGGLVGYLYKKVTFEPYCFYKGESVIGGQYTDAEIMGLENTFSIDKEIPSDTNQNTISKGKNPIKIHVEANRNMLADYIQAANVTVEGIDSKETNESGNVEFDNTYAEGVSKETTFTVTKDGYRDYISDIIIYNTNADLLFQSNSVQINMTKLNIEDNERPYISTLVYKSPYSDIKNVLINKETFSQDDGGAIHFKAYAVWNGKTPDKFVLYQENGFSIESKDGNFTVFAKSFEPSKDIYIRAVAADGTQSISECTKIKIKAPIVSTSTEPTLSFINMDNTFLPSDIPFLNDTNLKIKLDLPFSYTVKDNKLRLAIGVIDSDGSTDATKTFADDEHWKEWKKVCESAFSQDRTAAEWIDDIKNLKMDWTSSVKLDCKAVGYFEFDLNNQNESIEGGINLSADAKATFQTQYAVGPVPVYFKFSFGGKFGGNYIGGYNFAQEKFYGRIDGSIEPYLSAEGGVGVLYVATVGVNGKGSMPIKMEDVYKGITSVDLKAELALTASVLCFDYKKTFPSKPWNLFPGEDNAQTLSLMSADNYELESRDYINNESVWYGSDNKIRLFSTSVMDESVLQSNIYPKAKPQIMVCDGKTIAVWLADNTNRDNINKTMLVYSVHNSNDTWSEPQAICDDGCADFYPYAKDGYVVWQKTNKKFSDNDDLMTLAGAGEIMYAKWNGNGFDTAVRVTNNNISDTMPRIATNGSDVSIVWVSNSDNNIWGTSGRNKIHIKNLSNITENTIDVVGLVANLDAEYINSKLQVAYTTDIDMDLNTLDDRGVYIYEDNNVKDITDSDILTSNPKYVEIDNETYLMWYSDNSIYSRDFNGKIDTVYTDESGLLSDDFNVITSDNGYAAIIWTATKDDEYRQIQGVIYNPQSKEWSKEVYISDSDSDVCYPDGIINNDGSMLLMYNRSSEQSDLCVTELVPSYDLAIEDVSYNESDIVPETDLPISVKIKNNGYLDVDTVSIDLNGNKQTIPTSIKPGETTNISCLYPIGKTVTHQTVTINVIVPNDTDNTPDDNNTILEIGYTDAEMALKSNVQDDKILCNINVTNNSYIDTTGTLTIRENSIDGEIIDSIDIGAITNDETHQIIYNIATSMLASYPDLKNIYFVVETDEDEIYNTNNYDFVAGILENNTEESTQILNPIGYYSDKVTIEEKVTGEQIIFTISPFNRDLSDLQLYVAEYNDSGALDKITIGESTVIDNSIVIEADLPKSTNYKLMIWDNRQCPLIEAITNIQ